MHPAFRAALLLGAVALLPHAGAEAAAAESTAASFDYLYLNATEDQASGGHTAIRIDDDVFHFQFQDGLLQMERDSWNEFELSYRGLQNRSIEQTRIAITSETHELLRAAFLRRHLTQSAQLDRVRATRADRDLIHALAQPAPPPLRLPGLGFFAAPPGASQLAATTHAASVAGLSEAIAARFGADALDRRSEAAEALVAELDVRLLAVVPLDFAPGHLPHPAYAFHERYADAVAATRALAVLQGGAQLEAKARLEVLAGDAFALQPADRSALERATETLEQRLVALFASDRPDWAHAMLLGMARLESMHGTLRTGQWQLLDVLSDNAFTLEVGAGLREMLPQLEAELLAEWRAAREAWRAAEPWSELDFARLERAAARASELEAVKAGAAQLRIFASSRSPRGLGHLAAPPVPEALRHEAASLRQASVRALDASNALAEAQMGYRLITRNCVSELFATVDIAMRQALTQRGAVGNRPALERETRHRLGGVVPASPIPFVSSARVREHWRVASATELRSLRREQVAHLMAEGGSPWVRLRESNTWSSTLYRPSERDSYFLFFTDESVLLRPFQGVANLLAGLGKASLGLARLPFDGGKDISAGLRGAVFSLPELAFFNIRKGSNAWLPSAAREQL